MGVAFGTAGLVLPTDALSVATVLEVAPREPLDNIMVEVAVRAAGVVAFLTRAGWHLPIARSAITLAAGAAPVVVQLGGADLEVVVARAVALATRAALY
jgi:hypothetical protein